MRAKAAGAASSRTSGMVGTVDSGPASSHTRPASPRASTTTPRIRKGTSFCHGEVALVTAGWRSLSGVMDFITIAGLCDWIDSVEELEELFPGYDGMARRISRFIRMSV